MEAVGFGEMEKKGGGRRQGRGHADLSFCAVSEGSEAISLAWFVMAAAWPPSSPQKHNGAGIWWLITASRPPIGLSSHNGLSPVIIWKWEVR